MTAYLLHQNSFRLVSRVSRNENWENLQRNQEDLVLELWLEMVIWALQCLSPESAWYRSVVSRVFINRQRGTTVAPLHHNAPHHPLPLRPKQTTVLLTTLAWPPKIRLLYLLSSSQLLNCTRNWHQTWNMEMQCAAFKCSWKAELEYPLKLKRSWNWNYR